MKVIEQILSVLNRSNDYNLAEYFGIYLRNSKSFTEFSKNVLDNLDNYV